MPGWRKWGVSGGALIALYLAVATLSGCGSGTETIEEERKLSLRLEHVPVSEAREGEDVDLHCRIHSSLDGPKLETWIRILEDEGTGSKVPLDIGPEGDAHAILAGKERGEEIRYVVEARDAAGLVVSLPPKADRGAHYTIRFQGKGSRLLGGISWLSTVLAVLLYLGAGVAAVQCLRGQMSAGPSGMLGGFGLAVTVVGLLGLGAIHAYQIAGRPWPPQAVLGALTRIDLGIVSLIWLANLVLGRKVLLSQEPDGTGERGFAMAGLVAGVLTLGFLIF